ncbi:MAG: FadR family transcriptional regulator [Firmicutes bacterium]|jgi:DNA-binding FadR family transcriptional regulator|nr:FadR family transcriptional regulator [Bacillota bacterium]
MIERMALHDMIVKEVKKYIDDNNLKPGDKLPPQSEFAKMFGLSRTSLREATRTLQALGIIEIINGKGMYVKSNIFAPDENALDKEGKIKRLIWVLEVRRVLEKLAVELAVVNATEDDLKVMEENLIIMEEMAEKSQPHPNYDKAFHYKIYEASGNPALLESINHMGVQFDSLWENPLGAGDAFTEGTNYHRELFDAIKNRDKKRSLEVFDKLIDQIEVILKNI